MVELDARHHRHLARELEERAVGLVGLHDGPIALPPGRVRAERAQLAADQEGRVRPASASASAAIDAVVVLPWVPATAINGAGA